VNLAYVTAPKISRKTIDGQFTQDEPFGWEAREFLRKKLVGKEVQFKMEYKIPMGNQTREFGIILLKDSNESVVETMVSEGLVEVVRKAQNKDLPEFIKLCELEELAKLANKGKWTAGGAYEKREVFQEVDEPAKLVNKTYNGIVEHVSLFSI
jgi:staphylococcal nuclease domain-containing protein 1